MIPYFLLSKLERPRCFQFARINPCKLKRYSQCAGVYCSDVLLHHIHFQSGIKFDMQKLKSAVGKQPIFFQTQEQKYVVILIHFWWHFRMWRLDMSMFQSFEPWKIYASMSNDFVKHSGCLYAGTVKRHNVCKCHCQWHWHQTNWTYHFSPCYFNGIKNVPVFKCILEESVSQLSVNFGNCISQNSYKNQYPGPICNFGFTEP